jgi:hypothetical protein
MSSRSTHQTGKNSASPNIDAVITSSIGEQALIQLPTSGAIVSAATSGWSLSELLDLQAAKNKTQPTTRISFITSLLKLIKACADCIKHVTPPNGPENGWKQLREQYGQHSKDNNTGDKVTTTEKGIPVNG